MHTFVSNVIMKICINVIYFIKRCLLLKARIFTCFLLSTQVTSNAEMATTIVDEAIGQEIEKTRHE